MIDGNQLREEFGRYLAEHKATRWGMDAALMHVCKIAYDAGKADGPGAALHSREYEIEVPAEPGFHPLKFTGLPVQNWRDEQLHALCEEMGEALSRLLDSDPNGAIATASDEVLLHATYDTQADAIVREQAAAILQARVARSKWKESK